MHYSSPRRYFKTSQNCIEMTKQSAERTRLFSKYPYIVAWGKMLGSFGYYIAEQCARAEEANAPDTATFYSDTKNKWQTIEDCHPDTKAELEQYRNGSKGGAIFN